MYACGWEKRECVCMWLGIEGKYMHVVGRDEGVYASGWAVKSMHVVGRGIELRYRL